MILALSLATGSCSLFEAGPVEVKLAHDASVTVGGAEPKAAKAGEVIDSEGEAVLVEAPGRVSVVVVPAHPNAGTYDVSLREVGRWRGADLQGQADNILGPLVKTLNELQIKLAGRKWEEALKDVDALMQKYPGVHYLKFYRATCLILLNRNEDAKGVLEDVLRYFPDNKDGRDLLIKLGGKPPEIKRAAEGGGEGQQP